MFNTKLPTQSELPTSRQLLRSTVIAVGVAAALLVTVVMPSEYAIDPTGVGRLLGLTQMGEMKKTLAEEAAAAGIKMMYQNVDVPTVRARFGGGYVGANLVPQGRALGEEAVRLFGLGAGDAAVVFIPLGQPGRDLREGSTADALEAAGLKVIKLDSPPEYASDPNLALPPLTAAVLNNPDVKLIVYPGGQMLGAVPVYMDALGKQPGELINIGFDTSPAIMEAFSSGYVQLTSDQQPFLQGYIPILSLCGTLVYGFGPMSLDTGAGFVDTSNYESVAELAKAGLR